MPLYLPIGSVADFHIEVSCRLFKPQILGLWSWDLSKLQTNIFACQTHSEMFKSFGFFFFKFGNCSIANQMEKYDRYTKFWYSKEKGIIMAYQSITRAGINIMRHNSSDIEFANNQCN